METQIQGNRVLLPDGSIGAANLRMRGGRIDHVSQGISRADYDAGNLLVVPGIVDIHGDAYERQIFPRAVAGVSAAVGLLETDRQMIANGITTAYHGLTVTWAPGSRDIHAARAVFEGLRQIGPRLCCDTKVHLRHEVLSLDTADEAATWMREGRIALFAINDHSHMVERSLQTGVVDRSITMPVEEYRELAARQLGRKGEVEQSVARLVEVALDWGVPVASHDDNTPEERARYRAMGCRLSEFPADEATATAARDAGDDIILGSPNILRGGSHCGRVGAAEMVGRGLCTILCSDYYYPAVLAAPFLLAADGVLPLARAWELVSLGPALAAGLHDRGTLAAGKRADVLFIDDRDPRHPEVSAAFVAGVPVYARGRVGFETARSAAGSLEEAFQ